jgi:hypothetical protein
MRANQRQSGSCRWLPALLLSPGQCESLEERLLARLLAFDLVQPGCPKPRHRHDVPSVRPTVHGELRVWAHSGGRGTKEGRAYHGWQRAGLRKWAGIQTPRCFSQWNRSFPLRKFARAARYQHVKVFHRGGGAALKDSSKTPIRPSISVLVCDKKFVSC